MWISDLASPPLRSLQAQRGTNYGFKPFLICNKTRKAMRTNRFLLPLIFTLVAAVGISSCAYRSYGPGPGYDYGYRSYPPRYYRVPPPPPRVVVVKPSRRVVHADRYRSSRYNDRTYRKQYRSGNHYGNNGRTRGPRR